MNEFPIQFHRLSALALVMLVVVPFAAFLLTVLITRPLISWLSANQFGKAIRVDGPDHAAKAGTPTMGGIGMLVVIGIFGLGLLGVIGYNQTGPVGDRDVSFMLRLIIPLVAIAAFSVLGFTDDIAGLARRSGRGEVGVGFTARKMLVAQFVVSVVIAGLYMWMVILDQSNSQQFISMYGIGPAGLGVIAVLVFLGTVNGVNLSDGLDGLAAGLLVLAFGTVGIASAFFVAYFAMTLPLQDLLDFVYEESWDWETVFTVYALPLVAAAACLGFLVFNRHPARVFMGNVASMGLGGGLAAMSLVSGWWILLPIFGIVFLAEVLSDIIQIGYFKWTGGKRFFRMAPLHHHFEKGGMPETQIVRRFWLAGLISSLVAIGIGVLIVQ